MQLNTVGRLQTRECFIPIATVSSLLGLNHSFTICREPTDYASLNFNMEIRSAMYFFYWTSWLNNERSLISVNNIFRKFCLYITRSCGTGSDDSLVAPLPFQKSFSDLTDAEKSHLGGCSATHYVPVLITLLKHNNVRARRCC